MTEHNTKRTVCVTGATGGIGKAICLLFARNGWNIVGQFAHAATTAAALQNEVAGLGRESHFIQADLSTETGTTILLGELSRLSVDALVNNAGAYIHDMRYDTLSMSQLHLAFTLNAISPLMLASALFPQMCQAKFGRIVNISSIAAKYGGSASSMHYGCAKRALEGVTLTLAREGASHNVLVNTVRPGVIQTPFHNPSIKDMVARTKIIPARRLGTAEEVANAVYFLGSHENTFITGQTLAISGGE